MIAKHLRWIVRWTTWKRLTVPSKGQTKYTNIDGNRHTVLSCCLQKVCTFYEVQQLANGMEYYDSAYLLQRNWHVYCLISVAYLSVKWIHSFTLRRITIVLMFILWHLFIVNSLLNKAKCSLTLRQRSCTKGKWRNNNTKYVFITYVLEVVYLPSFEFMRNTTLL